MAKRPKKYDANFPKNLTYRPGRRAYYWRKSITGEEITIGVVARRDAVAQAIEANNYIEMNSIPSALIKPAKIRWPLACAH